MKDEDIIRLYLARSEQALKETAQKYEALCMSISQRILGDREDARECVNEAWFKAWNSIPPQIPQVLPAYLGSITRNLAITRYRMNAAEKRTNLRVTVPLEELGECVSGGPSVESRAEAMDVREALNRFLGELKAEDRKIFMRRYYYMDSVKEISEFVGRKESYVKTSLHRTRQKLKEHLQKEGIEG